MKHEHIEAVVNIHITSWATYEISVILGKKYLIFFYNNIVISPYAFGYVYIDKGTIVGYCTGFLNYNKFNKIFFKKIFFLLIYIVFVRLLRGKLKIDDIFDMASDTKKLRSLRYPKYHLGALALSDEYKKTRQGGRIIIELIEKVLKDFCDNKCGGCWGVCNSKNRGMQKLLLGMGFEQVDSFSRSSKTINVFEKILNI